MPNETTNTPILTLDSDAKLETAQSISDLTWHEIQNAYRTRRILTGMLGGIEIMGSLPCGRTKSSTICLDVRLIF